MSTKITLLSDDALDVISGGLDMNPATNAGHFAGITKLPPAPASSPGTEGSGGFGLLGTLVGSWGHDLGTLVPGNPFRINPFSGL